MSICSHGDRFYSNTDLTDFTDFLLLAKHEGERGTHGKNRTLNL